MSHRGRKIAAFFIALVVLGLVLNNISSRTRSSATQPAAGESAKPAARPVAPLYVPRPESMISGGYGGALSTEAAPQDVAKAFAMSYYRFDPDRTTPKAFAAGLPRLAPTTRAELVKQLPEDWEAYLSKTSGTKTPEVTVGDPNPDPDTDSSGKTEVTVDFAADSESTGALRLSLGLEDGDDGWTVTSVTLDKE
ncbi:hypothetical protein GCM10011579_039730 [Streptomyces albiflavescens]|uniref:Uncharacterized protein n=1 Tax=Streptomyces albiflavescens TaxID=1623582 RepID=A0A917Y6W8_9ACTN|nr:hypothetical protein [Streptomyces albiflavescens]GGN67323.1 hypothetical protein GCM10011579_039730 [Streptomyces albiflavescens]